MEYRISEVLGSGGGGWRKVRRRQGAQPPWLAPHFCALSEKAQKAHRGCVLTRVKMYATIKNNSGQIFGSGKWKTVTENFDVAKREFAEHALEWLRDAAKGGDSEFAPVLTRLSDRSVVCSAADAIPESVSVFEEIMKKSKQLRIESAQRLNKYDTAFEEVIAKIMNQTLPMETNHASYAIVHKIDGEYQVCEESKNIFTNTLENHTRAFKSHAMMWGRYAEKDCPPPVLMRLSDGTVLYSVTDFQQEMQALRDGAESEAKRIEGELVRLEEDFDAKLKVLVRGLLASTEAPSSALQHYS